MNCHVHIDTNAVSQCLDCGKGLCPNCTNKFKIPICVDCNLARINTERDINKRNIVLMIIGAVIGIWIVLSNGDKNILSIVFGAYMFAGVPWGWSALNRITPNVFLFLPLAG